MKTNEIHIWLASPNQVEDEINELTHFLSAEEKKRSEEFYFEIDRLRFIARQGIRRKILSRYLDCDPKRLSFHFSKKKKPYICRRFNKNNIQFSASHSNGACVFAISRFQEIGLDIEFVRDLPDAHEIVKCHFTDKEKRLFNDLPNDEKQEVFFTWWTRKEAILKAIGAGLGFPLNKIDVCDIKKKILFLRGTKKKNTTSQWSILPLKINSGFKASVATNKVEFKIRYKKFVL